MKFWEEQDQINQALIPRVIKNHEMITDLTKQLDQNFKAVVLLEEKIEELNKKIDVNQNNGNEDNNEKKFDLLSFIGVIIAITISLVGIFV